jgi:NB-ARC domain/Ternary complex associated domain 9
MKDDLFQSLITSFPGVGGAFPLRPFDSGRSNSPVWIVDFQSDTSSGLTGSYVVKVGSPRWAQAEAAFYTSQAAASLADHLARFQAISEAQRDAQAIAYDLAYPQTLDTLSLVDLLRDYQHEEIRHQTETLARALFEWNEWSLAPRQDRMDRMAPPDAIRSMLGRRAEDLGDTLAAKLPWWDQRARYFVIDGADILLPNPLTVLDPAWWPALRDDQLAKWVCPLGFTHGDLHGHNILCLPATDHQPRLIDFSDYAQRGIPFFDLAYLEYDILQHVVGLQSPGARSQWLALLDVIMADILPKSELQRDLQLAPLTREVWFLIEPLRQTAHAIATQCHPTHSDGYVIAWRLASIAAGLNFARKGTAADTQRPERERVAALLYAAYALRHLLRRLKRHPTADAHAIPVVSWLEDRRTEWRHQKRAGDGRLPVRATKMLDRSADVATVTRFLRSPFSRVIAISGFPGVGKTTLAKEIGYAHLPPRTRQGKRRALFDMVIWIAPDDRSGKDDPLERILDVVSQRFGYRSQHAMGLELSAREDIVSDLLEGKSVLLVLDSVEDLLGSRDAAALASWIHHLPDTTRVLLTTRSARLSDAWDVCAPKIHTLQGLPEADALRLAREEIGDGGAPVDTEARDQFTALVEMTAGNPLAIKLATGVIKKQHLTLRELLQEVRDAGAEAQVAAIFETLFARSWARLPVDARHVLVALTFFTAPVGRELLHKTMGSSRATLERSLERLRESSLIDIADTGGANFVYSLHRLLRTFVTRRLPKESAQWEREARTRWVNAYLDFSEAHGGLDWAEWSKDYDHLESEWSNLKTVFAWCAANGRFDELAAFWLDDRVHRFAHIYGYWQDRLEWFDWLDRNAEQRGDMAARVKAMTRKTWTLLQLDAAEFTAVERLLPVAWAAREQVDPYCQCELMNNHILLHIRRRRWEEAAKWIETKQRFLDDDRVRSALDRPEPDRPDRNRWLRQSTWIPYYQALILYYTGKTTDDVRAAGRKCLEVLSIAQRCGWQRQVLWAYDLGANLAIREGRLIFAHHCLERGMSIARRNKDKRPIALFERGYATLEFTRGNFVEAAARAETAEQLFKALGMARMADKMRILRNRAAHKSQEEE